MFDVSNDVVDVVVEDLMLLIDELIGRWIIVLLVKVEVLFVGRVHCLACLLQKATLDFKVANLSFVNKFCLCKLIGFYQLLLKAIRAHRILQGLELRNVCKYVIGTVKVLFDKLQPILNHLLNYVSLLFKLRNGSIIL